MIEKVKKYALLGTEKLLFDVEQMPHQIKEYLQNSSEKDNTSQLLSAITLCVNFDKVGIKLNQNFQESLTIAPTEFQPYCSPFASNMWKKIVAKSLKHPFLIHLYLDRIIANNWIVTPDIIVDLLEIGTIKKNEHLHLKIAQVLGQRGEWLTQYNPKWEYILPQDNIKLFNEGKTTERLAAFRRLRKIAPNMARVLLIEKWDKETAKEKKAFLEALSIEYSTEDEAFVEKAKKDINWQETTPNLSIFQTPQQIEKAITETPQLLNHAKWELLPLYFAWSKPFSEFMLQETYQSFQYSYFTRGTSLQPWFACLNPNVNLEAIPRLSDSNTQKYYWSEYCSKELAKIIELCRNIAQI